MGLKTRKDVWTSMMPPFLRLSDVVGGTLPVSTVHRNTGSVISDCECHVLWWPPALSPSGKPRTILYLIPGNPGQVSYFNEFLGRIHDLHPGLGIVAKAHIGHTPWDCKSPSEEQLGLTSQVESAVEMVDVLRETYPQTRIVLAGHSIGAWIAMQVVKARPDAVNATFLLCPTLSNIAATPNGLKMFWVTWPFFAFVGAFVSPLLAILPLFVFRVFFPEWSDSQLLVLVNMLAYPEAIVAALRMACDEFTTVKTLDTALLRNNAAMVHLFYAAKDDWVGEEKAGVLSIVGRSERVYEDAGDIPHAFCVTTRHSRQVAQQCSLWLREGNFVDS